MTLWIWKNSQGHELELSKELWAVLSKSSSSELAGALCQGLKQVKEDVRYDSKYVQ